MTFSETTFSYFIFASQLTVVSGQLSGTTYKN
jgi:hypothetical protein